MKNIHIVLIIVLVAVLVYTPIIDNFFVTDDILNLYIVKEAYQGPKKLFLSGSVSHTNFRPVTYMVLLAVYSSFKLNPMAYKILSIIFHAAVSILVFYVGLHLTNRRLIAFVAALLFAVNSTHSDAIIWMGGSHSLFVTFFYLLTFLFFILYIRKNNITYYWLSFVSCVLAFLSKETSATIIIMLYLYEWLIVRKQIPMTYRLLRKYIPFLIITIIYVVFELVYQQSNFVIGDKLYGIGPHIIVNIIHYIESFLLGLPQTNFIIESNVMFIDYFPNLAFLLPMLKWLVLIVFALVPFLIIALLLFGSNTTRFLSLWVIITLLPFSLFTYGISSRYTYLPSFGFILLLTLFLFNIPRFLNRKLGKRILLLCICILMVVYIIFTNMNERIFDDEGEQVRSFITQLKENYPDFDDNSELYFINPPPLLLAGVGRTHLTELVQLYYDNPTLVTHGIIKEEVDSIPIEDNIYIFENNDKLIKIR